MSLIETYQSCKSLFAEKLITKGVNAEGSDGLTTLINKIEGIQQFGNGVFVWADKPILQDGETSNLYGLVLEDGAPVVGEQVHFYDSDLSGFDGLVFEDSFERTAPSYTQTPEKLTVSSTSTQGMTALTGIQFDGDYTVEFKCKGSSVYDGMRFSVQSVNATSIEQYILAVSYTRSHIVLDYNDNSSSATRVDVQNPADSNEHTVKFKIIEDSAKLYFDGALKTTLNGLTWLHDELQLTFHSWDEITLEVYDFRITGDLGYDDTDSKGLATVGYSGKGSGVLNIKAECMFVSKTYNLYDTIFYDKATEEPPLNTWVINGFTPTYSENGTTLTSTTFATCFANKLGTGVNVFDWDSPVCIEFDIVSVTSTDADIQLYDNTNNATRSFNILGITGNNHVKILVEDDKIRYFVDGVEKTSLRWDLSIGTFRVGLRGTGTITFKDFMIYPI